MISCKIKSGCLPTRLDFRGGVSVPVQNFLKPDERLQGVISKPLKFVVSGHAVGVWSGFAEEFTRLLTGRLVSGELSLPGVQGLGIKLRMQVYRVAVICASAPNLIAAKEQEKPELGGLPVKLKLLSNMTLQAPRTERGVWHGICDPEDLDVKIKIRKREDEFTQ